MPRDANGAYVDLVGPVPAPPLDVAGTVNRLAAATPAARTAFLDRARQRMTPETFAAAVGGLAKAAANRTGPAGTPYPGPAGTYFPTSPLPRRPGPAASDDPVYQQVLASSGVRYPQQQFINDPGVR